MANGIVIRAIKAAWAYCDKEPESRIVCQARREDMHFKEYLAMDIRENYSQEIPEEIREQTIEFIMEHYNL